MHEREIQGRMSVERIERQYFACSTCKRERERPLERHDEERTMKEERKGAML